MTKDKNTEKITNSIAPEITEVIQPEEVVIPEKPGHVINEDDSNVNVLKSTIAKVEGVKIKYAVQDSDEIKFLRTLAYTQFHGGRGTYLNEMIIERAKVLLKTDNVFIENGEIIN